MIFYANNFQNLLTFKVVLEKASSALTDTFVFATVIARGFQERQQQAAKWFLHDNVRVLVSRVAVLLLVREVKNWNTIGP